MNNKPKLHYHTDCDFFAGCENMIANFLNSDQVYQNYDVTFSYRSTDRYEQGFKSRVTKEVAKEAYPVLSGDFLLHLASDSNRWLKLVVRTLNYVLLIRLWVFLWNTFTLYRVWKNKKIDILHINNGGYPAAISCLSASVAARMAGIRYVVMVVNNLATSSRLYVLQDRLMSFFVKKCVTFFVTGSLEAKKYLKLFLKITDDRIWTLHNGIAPRAPNESVPQTRKRLGIVEGKMIFGTVALMEKRKGHRVLIQAVSELQKVTTPDKMPVFLFEGHGPEKAELEQMVEQLNLKSFIHFVGQEMNIFNFTQAIDVFILPSIANEDFPNVILEAMSLGKPVIASRLAGTPEQVVDGKTGWLFEVGDVNALRHKISNFINNPELINSMGSKAKASFQDKFSASIAVERYLNLYKTLLTGAKK